MIRVFCNYKTTNKPCGGANNFLKSLYKYLEKSQKINISFNRSIKNIDLIFFNQISKGPGNGTTSLFELIKIIFIARQNNIKILTRVVNLNAHAFNKGIRYYLYGYFNDFKILLLLYFSDEIIYQSKYQMNFFLKFSPKILNIEKIKSQIIYNGSNLEYVNNFKIKNIKDDLILVSNTFSPRKSKNHYLISQISLIKGVKVFHIGNWPKKIDKGNVIMLGVLNLKEILKIYEKSHYLLHPAIKDPCPNVLFESISSNLPVIYNPSIGSSQEIVNGLGLPININDLDQTIQKAKEEYEIIHNKLCVEKSKFSINYSAKIYAKVFQNL